MDAVLLSCYYRSHRAILQQSKYFILSESNPPPPEGTNNTVQLELGSTKSMWDTRGMCMMYFSTRQGSVATFTPTSSRDRFSLLLMNVLARDVEEHQDVYSYHRTDGATPRTHPMSCCNTRQRGRLLYSRLSYGATRNELAALREYHAPRR